MNLGHKTELWSILSSTLVRAAKDVGVDISVAATMQSVVQCVHAFLSSKSDEKLAEIGVDFSIVEWAFFSFFADTIALHELGDPDSHNRAVYFRDHVPARQLHVLSDDLRAALVTSQQFSVCARAILHVPLCASTDMVAYLCFVMAGTVLKKISATFNEDKRLLLPLFSNIDTVLTLARRDFPANTGIEVLAVSINAMIKAMRSTGADI